MDKLQRYNQKLLAVGGTMLISFAVIVFLLVSVMLLREFFQSRRDYRVDDRSLVTEESPDPEAATVVKKDISFEQARLIDTLNQVYLIPVAQVNLEKPEIIENRSELVSKESYAAKTDYVKYSYSGAYNNIMMYDAKADSSVFLFDEKLYISDFYVEAQQKDVLLFIKAASVDTNEDHKLNFDDLLDLYVYRVGTEKPVKISYAQLSFYDYYILHNQDFVLTSWYADKSKDGEVQPAQEPKRLKLMSLSDFSIQNFISDDEIMHLRKLIN